MPIEQLSKGVYNYLLQIPETDTAKLLIAEQAHLAQMVMCDDTVRLPLQKASFMGRLNSMQKLAEFLGTPLPAGVVVQHHMHFAHLPVHQRMNQSMVDYIKGETSLQHALYYVEMNTVDETPTYTVEGFYAHMKDLWASFGVEDEALLSLLTVPKTSLLTGLADKGIVLTEQFMHDVQLASKFDLFRAEFQAVYRGFEAGFAKATGGHKKQYFDHNQLNDLLQSLHIRMEDVTGAFQFEEWFFSHFVGVTEKAQEPAIDWHKVVMTFLSHHSFKGFERLNPNTTLGILVLCGRIANPHENPNHIPPGRVIDWASIQCFKEAGLSASAQSKGEALVKVMNAVGSDIGMDPNYLATSADLVIVRVMDWMVNPKRGDAITPFSFALQHYKAVVEQFHQDIIDRAQSEETEKRREAAKAQQAAHRAKLAELNALAQETRTCHNCTLKFTFYFPKGTDVTSHVEVVPEGQLNPGLYCPSCKSIICNSCMGNLCLDMAELKAGFCMICQDTVCRFCSTPVGNAESISQDNIRTSKCATCWAAWTCECGNDIPRINLYKKKCRTCNICSCGGDLLSSSEQSLGTCNLCLDS